MTYDPNQHQYDGQPYGQQSPVVSGPPASPYPAGPYGQVPAQPYAQPGYPMQPPAPKKKAKWPWIVGGIVLVGVLGCVGLFTLVLGGTAKVAGDLDDNSKGKNAVAGQMNKPIKDGKFQFTVTGMKCGVANVGGEFGQKAQGEFCLIDMSVKNVSAAGEVFTDMSQTAEDAAGNQFSADTGAGLFVNKESSTFLEQINPGNTVKGKLVFDVPAGTKLTAVVLHESMLSPGVRIPPK